MSDTTTPENLAGDLLKGADEIAAYLGETRRSVYHQIKMGTLPTFKRGRRGVQARKSELAARLSAKTK